MVLNKYRGSASKILLPLAKAFSGLHPNTISAVSLIFAILAGIAFIFANRPRYEDMFNPGHYIYIMLAIASVCIFLNGFLDAIDGQVARLTKRTSKRGDFFDHALDRYADIFILGGIMLSPYCNSVIGALAIIAVLLTSYMGTQAQALGCGRNYSGLLGRADRLVILTLAPLIQMWVNYYIPSGRVPLQGIITLTILEWTMIWFIIAGNATAIHRAVHSWSELRDLEKPQKTLDQFYTQIEIQKSVSNPERSIPIRSPKLDKKESRPTRASIKHDLKLKEEKPRVKRKTKAIQPSRKPKPSLPKRMTQPMKTKPLKTKRKTKPRHKLKTKPKTEPLHKLKTKQKSTKREFEKKPGKMKTKNKAKSEPKPLKLKRKTKSKQKEPAPKLKPRETKVKGKTKAKRKTKSMKLKPKMKPKPNKQKANKKSEEIELKPNRNLRRAKTKPLKLKTKAKATKSN